MHTDEVISKIQEQIGNTRILDEDPTPTFTRNIQIALSKLKKKGRFTDKEYEEIYPTDALPPRMYGTLKAHKPQKNYPMRVVVSTIGTPNYGLSKYLVRISQNTLNKNPTRIKNTQSFVEEAKTWDISPEEVQVSYDVVNLYPSVPIKESIEVLVNSLNEDFDEVKNRTKLSIVEIKTLLEVCLSKCYFLWNGKIHEMENSGPIGLSLMVVMAESYLQYLEGKAIHEALHEQPPVDPMSLRRFVDDSHARFYLLLKAEKFKDILNRQDRRVQYTMEIENENKALEFMEVETRNNGRGKYEFKVFRKAAITNVQVKPTSSHDPKIIAGIFKGFIHRARRICSDQFLEEELEFLVNVFVENGYEEKFLRKMISETSSRSLDTPVAETESMPTVTLPWIPIVSPKLRKVYRKAGYKVTFRSGPNLQTILTKKNKVKLPINSYPGVYRIPCGCKKVPPYIGQTKARICTRIGQHKGYVENGQWTRSGIAFHAQTCEEGPLFDEATTIKQVSNRFDRCVREALEIQKNGSMPRLGGINKDDGQYVTTLFWMPFMNHLTKEENARNRRKDQRRRREPLQQQQDLMSNSTDRSNNLMSKKPL